MMLVYQILQIYTMLKRDSCCCYCHPLSVTAVVVEDAKRLVRTAGCGQDDDDDDDDGMLVDYVCFVRFI
jgi:hypothetical protein